MSSSAFKALAESLMKTEDIALMDHLYFDPDPPKEGDKHPSYWDHAPSTGCDFIDNWRDWERTLRLNCARHRAIKLKREGAAPIEPPLFPADAAAIAVKAVVGTASPLEAEIMIDRARWHAIEVMAGNDFFDRNIIFAYYLKLVLLERKESFDAEVGFTEYKSLYASVLDSATAAVNAQHAATEVE
jgi:hypothetical protein